MSRTEVLLNMNTPPIITAKPENQIERGAPSDDSATSGGQGKILVVDDDPQIRASLGKVLRAEGYEVVLAAAVQEGIETFNAERIDLLLLDLNLAGDNGWDLFERFTSQNPLLPIVIITGRANQHELATGAGVGALMQKPLNVPVLLQTITDLLAESAETRLKRLVGLRQDTRQVPPAPVHNGSRQIATKPGGSEESRHEH